MVDTYKCRCFYYKNITCLLKKPLKIEKCRDKSPIQTQPLLQTLESIILSILMYTQFYPVPHIKNILLFIFVKEFKNIENNKQISPIVI